MAKPESSVVKPPRIRKPEVYKRGKFQKRIKHPGPKLISGWQNLRAATAVLYRNRRLFGGITLVYAGLTLVLVRGLSQGQLAALKQDEPNSLRTGLALVGNLFSSSGGSAGQAAATYQSLLLVLVSLVLIWALRQTYAQDRDKPESKPGKKPQRIAVKAAFYNGCYPLVQFVLVLLVMSLQLIPLLVGATIYGIVINNGLAVGSPEKIAWAGVFFVLAVWSLYMVTSTIFALYIVTLPDVTPLQALRSAKELVRYRRWTVMRKLLFLPFFLLLAVVVIMLPLVLWLTVAAEWLFLLISLGLLAVVHAYIYNLYREML